MPKTILLCVNSDIGRASTIGFRFTKIAEALQNRKINFKVIARSANSTSFNIQVPWFKNYVGRLLYALHVYVFPTLSFRWIDSMLFDFFVLHLLKKENINYELAHFGEYAPRSIGYLKKKGTKILLDIPIGHKKYDDFMKQQGLELDKQIFDPSGFLDESIAEADVLVVPSNFVKKTLEYAGVMKEMVVIPFGANPHEDRVLAEHKNDKIRFIFAGSISLRKGIKQLLEAWKKCNLANAELVICGRVYKELRDLTKDVPPNVKFTGFVDLAIFFKKSDVFVFPSLFEGSAKVVYEAMSYGLPVITTENAGSIVENDFSGFIINAGDVEELVKKINFFYCHRDQVLIMGKNAAKAVRKYTWEAYGDAVVDVYEGGAVSR